MDRNAPRIAGLGSGEEDRAALEIDAPAPQASCNASCVRGPWNANIVAVGRTCATYASISRSRSAWLRNRIRWLSNGIGLILTGGRSCRSCHQRHIRGQAAVRLPKHRVPRRGRHRIGAVKIAVLLLAGT